MSDIYLISFCRIFGNLFSFSKDEFSNFFSGFLFLKIMHKMNNNSSELFIFNSTIFRQLRVFENHEEEGIFRITKII